jgi:hypothetical protein
VSERETFVYPRPDTLDFWKLYAEPIDEFLTAARQLRDALHQVWFPERPDDLTVLESQFLEGEGLNRLHMLTGSCPRCGTPALCSG